MMRLNARLSKIWELLGIFGLLVFDVLCGGILPWRAISRLVSFLDRKKTLAFPQRFRVVPPEELFTINPEKQPTTEQVLPHFLDNNIFISMRIEEKLEK
jgi:hypothetical protein